MKISGSNIKKIELRTQDVNGRWTKQQQNTVPADGLISFDPPLEIVSLKVKIKSTQNNQVVSGFKINILGCMESNANTVYPHTETTTPIVTFAPPSSTTTTEVPTTTTTTHPTSTTTTPSSVPTTSSPSSTTTTSPHTTTTTPTASTTTSCKICL